MDFFKCAEVIFGNTIDGGPEASMDDVYLKYDGEIMLGWIFANAAGDSYYLELSGSDKAIFNDGCTFYDEDASLVLEWVGTDDKELKVSGAITFPQVNGIYKLISGSGTNSDSIWQKMAPEATLRPNTWNGYKAVLITDEDGKKYYEFEETLTEGLTFGNGFTPVAGKVYDSEAMIRATLSEKNKYPEIASPIDMTGYIKDDWVVSESDYRFDSTKAWNGFYPNGIWAGDDWLQWQNTAQRVLVRQLTFGYGGNSNWIYSCRLDGSDDGEHWTEIGTRDCEYEGEANETILTYPENETAYYYHRLVVLSSNGCAVVWNLLAKREIDGKNTP